MAEGSGGGSSRRAWRRGGILITAVAVRKMVAVVVGSDNGEGR